MKWYEKIEALIAAKGKEKLALLIKWKDDDDLFKVLDFLLNPRIVTGISKKKFEKDLPLDAAYTDIVVGDFTTVNFVMDYLKKNCTGKDDDVIIVKSVIESLSSQSEKDIVKGIIIKDLPLGISASTVNKARKNFIPVFKLQKGILWDGGKLDGIYSVSLKLDGNSATVFNLDEETYMLSRSGAVMVGFDHILDEYRKKLPMGYVYQGELLAMNYDKLSHGPLFQLSNGITNSKTGDKTKLQHVIFDAIDIDAFRKGKSTIEFSDRVNPLKAFVKKYDPYGDEFEIISRVGSSATILDSEETLARLAQEAIEDGLEGLMICKSDSIYKVGKQKWLQKVKEFKTMDLEVVDFKEHIRGDKVGSLVVNYKGGTVNVGGIKDEDRISWWNDPNSIVGKIVEVKYFRETTDKHDNKSLRFPTFVRVRDDKFEESYE